MILRNTYLEKIQNSFNSVPIIVLIGARQVGKTSLMKSFNFKGETLFLNGQNPEIAEIFQSYSNTEKYLKINLEENLNGLLLIDEFQFIKGISTILKLLTDSHEKLKVLCSGSSSMDILKNVEESLAGRIRIIEVFSLSFSEYLKFTDIDAYKLYKTLDLSIEANILTKHIQDRLNEYLVYGGLPRAALVDDMDEKIEILNDIYQTYLLRDVRSFINNRDFVGFNKLLRILAVQNGNLININSLSKTTSISYRKVEEYLYVLQNMYIIKLIEPFYSNKSKAITKMKKVYFTDLGLKNIIDKDFNQIEFRKDNGPLYENYVLLELFRNTKANKSINFYRTSDGIEVDFIVNQPIFKIAVEVKVKHLERPISIASFNNFCNENNIEKRYIINQNLNIIHNKVHIIPGFLSGFIK